MVSHLSPSANGRTPGRGGKVLEWGFLGEVSDYLNILASPIDRDHRLYYELRPIVRIASPSIDRLTVNSED